MCSAVNTLTKIRSMTVHGNFSVKTVGHMFAYVCMSRILTMMLRTGNISAVFAHVCFAQRGVGAGRLSLSDYTLYLLLEYHRE